MFSYAKEYFSPSKAPVPNAFTTQGDVVTVTVKGTTYNLRELLIGITLPLLLLIIPDKVLTALLSTAGIAAIKGEAQRRGVDDFLNRGICPELKDDEHPKTNPKKKGRKTPDNSSPGLTTEDVPPPPAPAPAPAPSPRPSPPVVRPRIPVTFTYDEDKMAKLLQAQEGSDAGTKYNLDRQSFGVVLFKLQNESDLDHAHAFMDYLDNNVDNNKNKARFLVWIKMIRKYTVAMNKRYGGLTSDEYFRLKKLVAKVENKVSRGPQSPSVDFELKKPRNFSP